MIPLDSSMPVYIRKMELSDIQRVVEIDHSSFSLPWPEKSYQFEIDRNEAARTWVAEIETEDQQRLVVGIVVAWFIVDEIDIATLAVAADYRQKNIAKSLLIHTLVEAAKEGAEKSYLEVRRSNQAARHLYSELGFEEDSVRPGYYEDNHEDAILMSLQKIHPDQLISLL